MRIGILAAMQQEVSILKENMSLTKVTSANNCKFFFGKLNDINIVVNQSGIGKVAATIGVATLLEKYQSNIIINIGSAGAFSANLNPSDIVIGSKLCYHDVNMTGFGYKMGKMAGQPLVFSSDQELVRLAKRASSQIETHVMEGLICTGDTFVCNTKHRKFIQKYFPSAVAVEMEGAAVAQTCHQFNVPFIVVRVISDVANHNSAENFKKLLPDTIPKILSEVTIEILKLMKVSMHSKKP
ncbi:5'-methylthioadenosine/S-adenosylhomocysteine [Candidatus Photodesmus blepharus]|uniref:adenosylhomocysteine nucleosidase n=1 Tax=Candidatus Photodesmus blepharonis TaxID=1179155 RepID=A0A084CN35_9GAMM|nr:5'-methylthioadenosine/adenosylhomocysteine nucleosidase [Candidatus Photodesmus blepharus]KEY91214.1 5'-methylthioadenosine/S-adenosylhomocysteine [Candidatus Photodesmus blepharus]